MIRISDFDENGIKSKNIKRYPYEPALEQYEIKCGDILLCMTGGTVGKSTFIHEIDEPSYINQRVALIRINKINTAYFYTVLSSPYLVDVIKSNKTSTNDNISMGLIEDFLIPLPPLIEQQRIVEKINFLEPLIQDYDKYEKQLTELESSFVDKLKKSILQYAIEGKLVKQDQNDEPASVLLERIKAEKEALIKTGKIKRDKNESYIFQGDDKNYYEQIGKITAKLDIPFEINNAVWSKLKNIAFITKLAGFEYSEYVNPNLSQSGVPLFKGKNVQNSKVVYEFEGYIPLDISNKLWRSQVTKKCLLTPYVGTIGNVGIHNKEGVYHLGSNVGKIEIYNNYSLNIMEEYVFFYLKSYTGYDELTKFKKATAQESISIDAIRETMIPIYPIRIQKMMVNKLNIINQLLY